MDYPVHQTTHFKTPFCSKKGGTKSGTFSHCKPPAFVYDRPRSLGSTGWDACGVW
ncbi:hypothetical protein PEX1_053730 [Penicillium expansum]|uniref:Uncharacterized protein n=1 Tax=Penicillium expansum TaxID=27334 RepID=A0A0A2K1Y2_PENEN|nr:hypothetical protein PEX2_015690 [Penicillium expansum]KGO40922.1 hypothetical protein PEXP_087050 [Penicillium expansum]KGO50847.1 hypothetical protein PEX1_053730 [Penicillium expansum]KGO61664.1 hypothetical protein PEX2_015690 [Penicillium expansum]